MPYRRKDSGHWWASYVDPSGKRVRRSTETEDLNAAKALEAKWRSESYQQQHWDKPAGRTFEEVMAEYLRASQKLRSFASVQYRVKRLLQSFAGAAMHDLKAIDVRQYIREREDDGVSNSTINRELAALSAAINHCNREWEWQLPNPVTGRMLKENEARERYLTHGEVGRLVSVAQHKRNRGMLADFVLLAVNTGCRLEEMLGLEWGRVELSGDSPVIRLEGRHTKSGKRRSIPLNGDALAALKRRRSFVAEYCPASPWVFARRSGERAVSIRSAFEKACSEAGITNVRIHDLRHTAASWMISEGASLEVVKELLGHSSITMTERYAHLAPHRVREAVNRLESRFGHGHNPVRLMKRQG